MLDKDFAKRLDWWITVVSACGSINLSREEMKEILDTINSQQTEIEKLQYLVDEMSGFFPTCIDCEGKTSLGERTDECLYLIGDTEYCAKKGIHNIAKIMKENEALKAEIETLKGDLSIPDSEEDENWYEEGDV